jgi:cell division protein FtsB
MRDAANVIRLLGRLALTGIVACVLAIVAMQFEGIVARNVALAHEIAASRADIADLRARNASARATIHRLGDARGAVPEIHERLRLVGPHEELIYVRPAPGDPAPDGDP